MNHKLIIILLAAVLIEGTCLAQTSQPSGAGGAATAPAAGEPARPAGSAPDFADAKASAAYFRQNILPILEDRCYECHGDGSAKGELSFDELAKDPTAPGHEEKWWQVLRMVRAGIMPPADDENDATWQRNVLRNAMYGHATLRVPQGAYTLKLWAADCGVVVQQISVNPK